MISKLGISNISLFPVKARAQKLGFGRTSGVPQPVLDYCTQKNCKPIARTAASDSGGLSIDLYLAKKTSGRNLEYKAIDSLGRELGYTELSTDIHYGRLVDPITGERLPRNTQESIYVELINTTDGKDLGINDVGTRLHQITIEESLQQGYGGRVKLDAAWGSFPFHYKCGFRMEEPLIKATDESLADMDEIERRAEEERLRDEFGENIIEINSLYGDSDLYYNAETLYETEGTPHLEECMMFLPIEHIGELRNKDGGIEFLN